MTDYSIASSLTSSLVVQALDASSLRHVAYAQNIASSTVPGYQPLRVNFEEQLSLARHDLINRNNDASAMRSLGTIQPRIEEVPEMREGASDNVRLDTEMAKLMQNAIFYQSLLTALGKNTSILQHAIRGGRS